MDTSISTAEKADIHHITAPAELSEPERQAIIDHLERRLAAHRNEAKIYVLAEDGYAQEDGAASRQAAVAVELDKWAQEMLTHAWDTLNAPGGGSCPNLSAESDTSVIGLPALPAPEHLTRVLNSLIFLDITSGEKQYSAHTRAFVRSFGPVDELSVAATLKHPERVLEQAQHMTESAKRDAAESGKTMRYVGMGLAGLAGGALIGITGGLAAPLVGGAVGSLFGVVGLGGTAAGALATGLATSSVVTGTLFGAYGARSVSGMVGRHIREVRDLELVPIRPPRDRLAVRLCVSGWLSDKDDVVAPWTVFGDDADVYALQWEVGALMELNKALQALIKAKIIGYLKKELIKRTVLAGLLTILSPTALLQFGSIIDNAWGNTRALAIKAGAVLGKLLAERVFGARPVTLCGYSLGALVIFEALKHLATLAPAKSVHLVQDVFLFGLPAPAAPRTWTAVRRVVAGRLVNGYSESDYVLAVLARSSDASWAVAGLGPVGVRGVENVDCSDVDGHIAWRGHIGSSLRAAHAEGLNDAEVDKQIQNVARKIDEAIAESEKQAKEDKDMQKELDGQRSMDSDK